MLTPDDLAIIAATLWTLQLKRVGCACIFGPADLDDKSATDRLYIIDSADLFLHD